MVKQLPTTTPVIQELFLSNNINIRPWSNSFIPPLVIGAGELLLQMHIEPVPNTFTNLMLSIPPWRDITELFLMEFLPELGVEHMTNAQANAKFKRLMNTKLNEHLPNFTDGSKISFPAPSVSATVIIPDANYEGKFKLSTNITVLGAELFAI